MGGLIKNYGLHWKRNNVFWGWQNNKGHLKGKLAGLKKSEPVDFAEQRSIYCLYDDNRRISYIGQTGSQEDRLLDRLRAHTTDRQADRWTQFSWFGFRWVKKDNELSADTLAASVTMAEALDHLEAILIATVEPPDNRQGGKFGTESEQYVQFRDENLGPPLEKMIEAIYHKMVQA